MAAAVIMLKVLRLFQALFYRVDVYYALYYIGAQMSSGLLFLLCQRPLKYLPVMASPSSVFEDCIWHFALRNLVFLLYFTLLFGYCQFPEISIYSSEALKTKAPHSSVKAFKCLLVWMKSLVLEEPLSPLTGTIEVHQGFFFPGNKKGPLHCYL